ncbi:MAG: hypothetical protein KGZ33_04705 [Alkaliphilus sp.]|nr:hypothetical protein [Alkaliphilus sp.]
MDRVSIIFEGLMEFILLFATKYKYENRGILKKMKIDSRLNNDIDNDKWSSLFLEKSYYNHCAKFVLLKYLEDNRYVIPKTNLSGLEKWSKIVKNLKDDYQILYIISIRDIQADSNKKIRELFKYSDYDIFEIDNDLAEYLINYYKNIDFSELSRIDISHLFKKLYSMEMREELALEDFYRVAPAFQYILRMENEENVI